MNFIPNTKEQQEEMLKEIGVAEVNDLFKDIPSEILLNEDLKIDGGLNEVAVKQKLVGLASKNKVDFVSFLGAGSYNHFVPSVVDHIISRSEFYTAYTPYQPEISQGVLQAIYEYQTMIADLTGMDVANASVYDGATALAEACIMAVNSTKRKKIVMLKSIHPEYKEVVKTYCKSHGFVLEEVSEVRVDNDTAAVLVQNPDFYGRISDLKFVNEIHEAGALLVVAVVEATSLGLLKSPGSLGADIVVGEGQSFGNGMNFGGPYLGIIAVKDKLKRTIPGRLVGKTLDADGEEGFMLTLQAREQHIRREKACSNICSNEALCALAATVHLAMLGKTGVRELGELNLQKAHYLADKLKDKLVFDEPFYNEFVIKVDDSKNVSELLEKKGVIGGLDIGNNQILICVTEIITKEDMDRLVELI